MKRKILTMCFLLLSVFVFADNFDMDMNMSVDDIPENVKEFVTLRDEIATTPSGGATMFVLAMKIYAEDAEEGMKCFTAILENDKWLVDDTGGYKGKAPSWSAEYLINMIDYDYNIPNSYFVGTDPDTAYEIPSAPYQFTFSTNRYSVTDDTTIKLFVACSGASSDRPITLHQNTAGIWKVREFSSLVVGIMDATVYDDGDDI